MHRFVRSLRQWTHFPHSGREERDHVIARGDERDAVADALDDTGTFVAEHAGRVARRVGTGGRVEVGVTDATGCEADEDLTRLRLGEIDLLDDERAAELLEDCCSDFHGERIVRTGASCSARRRTEPRAPVIRGWTRSLRTPSPARAREASLPRCPRSTGRRRPRPEDARSPDARGRRSRARPPRAAPSNRGR